MKKTYSEKLKDPRWQKMRLEILERDGFSCTNCGETQKELQIHHLFYKKGEEPWETQEEFLKTLCCDCHAIETKRDQFFKHNIAIIKSEGLGIEEVEWIVEWLINKNEGALDAVLETLNYSKRVLRKKNK